MSANKHPERGVSALQLGGARDTLFETREPGRFAFDADVVRVFDDMIDRSVPLYRQTELAVASTVAAQVPDGGHVLDLGCSTGTGTLAIAAACLGRGVRVTGWDLSSDMVARATEKARGVEGVSFEVHDVSLAPMPSMDVCCAIYTLQFAPAERRAAMLARIREAIRPGGVLVWAEKMSAGDAATQQHWDAQYEAYKRSRGYSQREIDAKREALRGVLVPWTEAQWREEFAAAGFARVTPLLRWLPFGSFVAWTA